MNSEQYSPGLDSFLQSLLQEEELHRQIEALEGQAPARVAMGKFGPYPAVFMARQVAGRSIAQSKMPDWYRDLRITYPPRQNLGQASVYQAAQFKASLAAGHSIADLTGGTGMDAWYMAQSATRFLYNELNPELYRLAQHNLGLLTAASIDFSKRRAEELWSDFAHLEPYDVLYLDPSRLDQGRKVIKLSEYSPDVTQLPDTLINQKKILLKLGPMLDLAEVRKVLPWVRQILVISVWNEVKEVLALSWQAREGGEVQAMELDWRGRRFEFSGLPEDRPTQQSPTAEVEKVYLFEPGAALAKAGLVREYAESQGLARLHPETPLYYAPDAEPRFGKTYRILDVLPGSPDEVRRRLGAGPFDVAAKGFPESAEKIIARHKLKTGGGPMLYFTRTQAGYVCLQVERVS